VEEEKPRINAQGAETQSSREEEDQTRKEKMKKVCGVCSEEPTLINQGWGTLKIMCFADIRANRKRRQASLR
jgi:hypothetical protein